MASTSSTRTDRKEEELLYETWMNLQREEITELEHAAAQARNGQIKDEEVKELIEKIMNHFQDYTNNRSRLARIDASRFFAPTSCTPLENSVLWIAGCRPSSFIRFAYALSGLDMQFHLTDFLEGKRIGDLTKQQMTKFDELQGETIRKERNLCSRLASLQEDIVDQPFASKIFTSKNDEEEDHHYQFENADEALDEHSQHMAGVMEEADELRMKTLKEIVFNILEPVQAVEYLAAAKRMRLCFQQWGKKRDHHRHSNKLD